MGQLPPGGFPPALPYYQQPYGPPLLVVAMATVHTWGGGGGGGGGGGTASFTDLFPPPVFDCLPYANTEGEGLGDSIMCGDVKMTAHRGHCPTVITPFRCQPVPGVMNSEQYCNCLLREVHWKSILDFM